MTRAARRRQAKQPVAARDWSLWLRAAPVAAILVVVSIGYHNALDGPFLFDDLEILTNPTIRDLGPQTLVPPSRSSVEGRPLVNVSFALNYAAGGFRPWGYHLVNVVIHSLAALTLYGLARQSFLRWPRTAPVASGLALAVAATWAAHPLGSEAVTYIMQRTESLMALCLLVTLYAVARGWVWVAVAANILGMGAKEVMAVAPVVVLAYDRLVLRSSWADVRRRWRLYAGLAAGWLVFGMLVWRRAGTDVGRVQNFDVVREYLATQAGIVVHYLRLAVWPWPLVGDYDGWPWGLSLSALASIVALALLTGWAAWRGHPAAFLGIAVGLVLAPTSLWPLVTEVAAERRMYLPLAAVVTAAVVAGWWLILWVMRGRDVRQRTATGAAIAVVVVAALVALTVQRNEVYRSTYGFWSDVVAKRPESARAHGNLGDYLFRIGRLQDALPHLETAARLKPGDPVMRYNLGVAYEHTGRLDEAVSEYHAALALAPDDARVRQALDVTLQKRARR
jgi:hypothetical protein